VQRDNRLPEAVLADCAPLSGCFIPRVPLFSDFPHITRRVAAQRSRLMAFGTDPFWLSEEVKKAEFPLKLKELTIEVSAISRIGIDLRESGVL
jgi:hypothetical protein